MTNTLESPQQETKSLSTLILLCLLFIGVFTLSLAAIFIRLSEQYIGPNATVFNRFWIATAIFGLWRGSKAIASQFSKDSPLPSNTYAIPDMVLLVVTAIAMSISHISWAWSITQTSIANANLLHNLTPIFATLGGWLLLSHNFDRRFLTGVLLTIAGAIVIGIQDFQIATDQLIGDGLALFSAVFHAASLLAAEKLRVKFSTTSILLWSCLLRSFLTFPVAVFTEEQLFPSSVEGWLPVFCLAFFCQVIGSGILAYSLKQFSSGFATLFLLLEPIITATLAWVIFAEHLSFLNLLAFVIVLVGIYIAKSGRGASQSDMKIIAEDVAIESDAG
ncbi:DMT family transporter [Plectonema radiosum NIES-515]|uniref:DMT family transporter n=1 Tax=Plectonema radiosum NIES-515 TaxID=2986073 RepID=A0ABT3B5C5_9CYAN|nr:DMT family transporter [Plectonema radiosum]MCV3216566.1 DMT family transporter [Plectonema radiosum NIES-515]